MIKKRIGALLGSGALLVGTLIFGAALPANAVPGCVTYGSSTGGNGITVITTTKTAYNQCGYVVSGRWSVTSITINGSVSSFTPCRSIAATGFNIYSTTASWYPLTGTGTLINKFVNC